MLQFALNYWLLLIYIHFTKEHHIYSADEQNVSHCLQSLQGHELRLLNQGSCHANKCKDTIYHKE